MNRKKGIINESKNKTLKNKITGKKRKYMKKERKKERKKDGGIKLK